MIWFALALLCVGMSVTVESYRDHAERRRKSPIWGLSLKFISSLFLAGAPVLFWYGETILSERRASDVLLDFSVDPVTKVLTVDNKGSVDVVDMAIFLTTYRFTTHHESIDSYSKIGGGPAKGAVWTHPLLPGGKNVSIDFPNLFSNKNFMPFYDGFPNVPDIALLTDYVLRLRFTNAITRKRAVAYVFVGAVKKIPSVFDTTVAEGGGYASGMEILKLRKSVIENQLLLFDDDPNTLYRN